MPLFGSFLFVEDEGVVLRYALENDHVRIGRDPSNDIWIDNPAVRPHTLLVYRREDEYNIKVYDGAKVLLNGAPVTGMHKLYSGDRIGVADREFLYGRDDTPPAIALGLTVVIDGCVSHAVAFRRTRLRVGRRGADLVLNDPSVADQHFEIECYGADATFIACSGSAQGVFVKGVKVDGRKRLGEGAMITAGRVTLRLHLMPNEAHGLLLAEGLPDKPKVPVGAPSPMDRSAGLRHDPGAQSPRQRAGDSRPVQGGFIRPLHQQNSVSSPPVSSPQAVAAQRSPPPEPSAVPVTEIGSLAQMLVAQKAAQSQPGPSGLIRKTPGQQSSPQQQVAQRQAVHVKPEVMAGGHPDPIAEHLAQQNARQLRGRPREDIGEMQAVSRLSVDDDEEMHRLKTNVLDTNLVRDHSFARDRDVPPPLPRSAKGGNTQVLDTIAPNPEPRRNSGFDKPAQTFTYDPNTGARIPERRGPRVGDDASRPPALPPLQGAEPTDRPQQRRGPRVGDDAYRPPAVPVPQRRRDDE